MSGIAGLYNIPSVEKELTTWAFVHAAHHRDINRIIFELLDIRLDEYVLDPFNPAEAQEWLPNHQTMHQQMDAVLGISGYNLLEVDFKEQSQFENWVNLNADEHFKAANLLGLG